MNLFVCYDRCGTCKKAEAFLMEHNIPYVYEVLRKGSEIARAAAAETLADVKRAMKINYFDPGVLDQLIAEQSQKYSK